MKNLVLILSMLIVQTMYSTANPLLGIWDKVDGPSSLLRYNYLDDSTVTLLLSDSSSLTVSYVVDTLVTPHRIRWHDGGITGNLGIWSISGNTLTIQASGGDTTSYPPSFTDPSHYTKQTTSVADNPSEIPKGFSLLQNYPNPFNPSTKIQYSIPERSNVNLKVYDVLGSEIATLVNDEKSIGSYAVEFDASALTSKIYFYQLQAGTFVETKKMVLMK